MGDSFRITDPFIRQPAVIDYENIPEGMKVIVKEVAQIEDQNEAVRYAYGELSKKYRGFRILTILRLDRFLITRLSALWKKTGFLHCNHLNYLLRTILIASGKFSQSDIQSRWTGIWYFSPHQYLVIHLKSGKRLNIDLWGKAFGIPFGEYAHGFHSGTLAASQKAMDYK